MTSWRVRVCAHGRGYGERSLQSSRNRQSALGRNSVISHARRDAPKRAKADVLPDTRSSKEELLKNCPTREHYTEKVGLLALFYTV